MTRLLALSLLLFALLTPASGAAVTQEYSWSGVCSDCDGTSTASLLLAGYTPGNPIVLENLVSFTYNGSNLLAAFTINQSNLSGINGTIPASLPGSTSFSIQSNDGHQFFSTSNPQTNFWCAGNSCDSDFGGTNSFVLAGVPEPGTVALVATGLGVLGFARRRRQ